MKAGDKILLEAEYIGECNGGAHKIRLKFCDEAPENDGQIMLVDESVIKANISTVTDDNQKPVESRQRPTF